MDKLVSANGAGLSCVDALQVLHCTTEPSTLNDSASNSASLAIVQTEHSQWFPYHRRLCTWSISLKILFTPFLVSFPFSSHLLVRLLPLIRPCNCIHAINAFIPEENLFLLLGRGQLKKKGNITQKNTQAPRNTKKTLLVSSVT